MLGLTVDSLATDVERPRGLRTFRTASIGSLEAGTGHVGPARIDTFCEEPLPDFFGAMH